MKNKTFILLDRSSSMEKQWSEALGSINAYVEKLNDVDILVATFDNISYEVIRNCSKKDYKNITTEEISPRGMTPLLDSSMRIMWSMLDSKADRAMLVIMTDGEENNSKHFKVADVTKTVKELEAKNYDILFLGANFDGIKDVATTFGRNDMSKVRSFKAHDLQNGLLVASGASQYYFDTGEITTNVFKNEN